MAAPRTPKRATFADLAALDRERAEIIHGVIEEKAAPTGEHSDAQGMVAQVLGRLGLRDPVAVEREARPRRQDARAPRRRRPALLDPEPRGEGPHRAPLVTDGYVVVTTASSGETVGAEPFDAVELRVAVLFGDEDDDE